MGTAPNPPPLHERVLSILHGRRGAALFEALVQLVIEVTGAPAAALVCIGRSGTVQGQAIEAGSVRPLRWRPEDLPLSWRMALAEGHPGARAVTGGLPGGASEGVTGRLVPVRRGTEPVGLVWVAVADERFDGELDQIAHLAAPTLGVVAGQEPERNHRLAAELQRTAAIGAWEIDATSGAVVWTDETWRLHGYTGRVEGVELDLGFVQRAVETRHRAPFGATLRAAMRTGQPFCLEVASGGDGRATRWLRVKGRADVHEGRVWRVFGTYQDVTEERRTAARLQQARAQLEAAIDSVDAAVALFDADERLVLCNPRYRDWHRLGADVIGQRKEDLLRRMVAAGVHGDADPEAWIADRLAAHRVGTVTREERLGGSWLRRAGRRTPDGGVVTLWTDISRAKAAEIELREATDRATAAAEVKAAFLATMSHEIRTPMNGLLGMAELLMDSDLDPDQRELVATLRRSGRALLVLLDDVLDVSKLEAGRVELEAIPFDLEELARDCLAVQRSVAEAKGLALEARIPEPLPRLVGDPNRLRQVLMNLLSNALKFTGEGGVTLEAVVVGDRAGQHLVRIAVEDTGIGIAPEAVERLFKPFTQADASTTRRFGGTGLGLTISRGLVERMGGALRVRSRLGEGSTFFAEIPFTPAPVRSEQAAVATPAAAPPAWEGRPGQAPVDSLGAHVLVAEDNPVNRLITRRLLEKLGCTAHVVDNGEQALDALADEPFDVVLMDCQMPVLDGYAATRALRRRGGPHDAVAVIALTAGALPEDRQRCVDAGMDDYVTKPIHLPDLVQALQRWSGREPVGEQATEVA